MNKIKQFKKRILIFGIVALFLIALPVTIYLVRQQQSLQQRAEQANNLSLNVSQNSVQKDEDFEVKLNINPQTVAVKSVDVVIKYDHTKLDISQPDFAQNSNFPATSTDFSTSDTIILHLAASNISNYIQPGSAATTIGTLVFTVVGNIGDLATIEIDSATVKDANDAVISGYTFTNTTVTIAVGSCIPNKSTCSWDRVDGADSYLVTVKEEGNDTPILDKVPTSDTQITFTSQDNKTYTCSVTATNTCGNTSSGESQPVTCRIPSVTVTTTPTSTPTSTVTPTNTPTLTPTGTVTPTGTLTPTNTPTLTPTGTVTPTQTSTPTPTLPEGVTATPTPTEVIETGTPTPTLPEGVTATPTQVEFTVVTSTPIPTLPATGVNAVTFGAVIAGALILIGGLLLLIL